MFEHVRLWIYKAMDKKSLFAFIILFGAGQAHIYIHLIGKAPLRYMQHASAEMGQMSAICQLKQMKHINSHTQHTHGGCQQTNGVRPSDIMNII